PTRRQRSRARFTPRRSAASAHGGAGEDLRSRRAPRADRAGIDGGSGPVERRPSGSHRVRRAGLDRRTRRSHAFQANGAARSLSATAAANPAERSACASRIRRARRRNANLPSREHAMKQAFLERLRQQTEELRAQGLYKPERVLTSPQQAVVRVAGGQEVVNLCANNYLGLANHPAVREAARLALDRYGYGMASVRFICGTQSIHKELEQRLSRFLGAEDAILYSSCFDANGGLFETLLDEQDAVISDALNHAS